MNRAGSYSTLDDFDWNSESLILPQLDIWQDCAGTNAYDANNCWNRCWGTNTDAVLVRGGQVIVWAKGSHHPRRPQRHRRCARAPAGPQDLWLSL